MSLMFRGTEEDRQSIEKECRLEYIFHSDEFVERFKESAAQPHNAIWFLEIDSKTNDAVRFD